MLVQRFELNIVCFTAVVQKSLELSCFFKKIKEIHFYSIQKCRSINSTRSRKQADQKEHLTGTGDTCRAAELIFR